MNSSLGLILIVVGGYLAAHVAFSWIAQRFHIVSGAEYLLLGLLLGPQVLGALSPSVVGEFAPFLTLSLGWIGVVVGAQFYLPEMLRISRYHYRIAFAEAVLSLAIVSAAMMLVLHHVLDIAARQAIIPAIAMGAVATASAPTGIALVARRLGRQGLIVRQLQLTSAIDGVVAITAFGLLLAVTHTGTSPTGARWPTPTEWAVITIAIGVLGGILFHLFLGEERKIDRLFIGLAGATILASGAAAHLRLSPLLPAMLIGAILINTTESREEMRQVLGAVERPLYFVLLIFAGAAWQPSAARWVLPVLLFLAARAAAKLAGGYLSAASSRAVPALGAGWGRALIGQGGLAVAIALNYQVHERSLLANLVFTAALLSVLLTDVVSTRVVERVVRAAQRLPALEAESSASRAAANGGG